MATQVLGRRVPADLDPPPTMPDERRASEDLLRRVDEALARLAAATEGLTNARVEYQRREHGTRTNGTLPK